MYSLCKSPINSPPISYDSGLESLVIDIEALSPFSKAPSLSAKGNHGSVSPVSGLLYRGAPLAVFFEIALAGVNSVKRAAFWPVAHILIKCLKGSAPSITSSNSPAAIQVKVRGFVIRAARLHALPAFVFSCVVHAMRGCGRLSYPVRKVASTAFNATATKISSGNDSLPAAVTNAYPVDRMGLNSDRIHCSKSAEFVPAYVFGILVKMYNSFSHVSSSLIDLVRGWGAPTLHSRYFNMVAL